MSYDPTLGRFLETDPAQYIDGPNLYQMERSNPITGLDPLGLDDRDLYLGIWQKGIESEARAGNFVSELFMTTFVSPHSGWAVFGEGDSVTEKVKADSDYRSALNQAITSHLKANGMAPCQYGGLAGANGGDIWVPFPPGIKPIPFAFESNVDLRHALHNVTMYLTPGDIQIYDGPCGCQWSVRVKVKISDRYDFDRGAAGVPINPFGAAAANDLGANLQEHGWGIPFKVRILFEDTYSEGGK